MKFLKIAIFFISLTSFAQSKVGAADIEYILSKMPEFTEAQSIVDTYGQQLNVDLNKKVKEYQKLAEEYKTNEATFTPEEKNVKQTAIRALDADIQKFQQNGVKMIEIKNEEAFKPLYRKIGEALEKVAKEQNYTQVSIITPDLVFLDPQFDLTNSILTEIGISISEDEKRK